MKCIFLLSNIIKRAGLNCKAGRFWPRAVCLTLLAYLLYGSTGQHVFWAMVI